MTNQKKRKNKIISFFLFLFLLSNFQFLKAETIECKRFDIKCKANKFIIETKEFQKKGITDSKKQLEGNKSKIKGLTPNK